MLGNWKYKRFTHKTYFKRFFFLFLLTSSLLARAGSGETKNGDQEKYDVKEHTSHHLLDQYSIDFYENEDGSQVGFALPRILYATATGLKFYGSTESALNDGWREAHEFDHEAGHGDLLVPQSYNTLSALRHESEMTTAPNKKAAVKKYDAALTQAKPFDFSITKAVFYMFLAAILLLLVFSSVAGYYKRREGQSPKGVQSFFEPVIVFVRDEIAKENIGHGYERFMPLLLTMFFFIWFLNLLGMMPFSGNVTGNISVTLALSIITLVVVNFSAKKTYWKHILWPDVPHGVKPIMVPLEIISIFTKPFALTIRLFANISGGHIITISLLSLIFIFGENGKNMVAGWGVGIFTSVFIVAIDLLELFVALLQAYVFTMLTAVFIGQAVEEHH
ncbi:MAG: F0F1 ATP synthase subunit A [Bacteroidota bacterium]|nr:F0F1 ATP synthase subunit A [Bacteroidota bacterium]